MRKREQSSKGLYCCPCCGYATLGEPEAYEICVVCGWEDDGQDDPEHKKIGAALIMYHLSKGA